MDRILQQILNKFIGQFIKLAMNKGMSHFAGGGKSAKDMTAAERDQARQAKELTQKMRKSQRASRKLF